MSPSLRTAVLLVPALCCACSADGTQPPSGASTAERRLAFATSDAAGFRRMQAAEPGDWLAEHPEAGQSFEDYVASEPVRATAARSSLAFLPLGPFEPEQREVARDAAAFAGLWFGLETETLEAEPLPRAEGWWRDRETPAGVPARQYLTPPILRRLLPRHVPDEAVVLVGVTMADLYPHPTWNYVFGEADLRTRVGVYSLARYFPEFWGSEPTADARKLALRRTLKVVTHEIGHTFGLAHCTLYECNMAGSNSLEETDAYPLRLCPVCLRKLQWNRGFDVLARYRRLARFCREHGLGEEAGWFDARVLAIQSIR